MVISSPPDLDLPGIVALDAGEEPLAIVLVVLAHLVAGPPCGTWAGR